MEEAKKAAGEQAADLVRTGMRVGLGTGSTTAFALRAIGRRIRESSLHVMGVPTSFASERLARECGIPLTTLEEVEALDLALDGADEVSPELNLIKGRGGAHTREKVVAAQAKRFVVLTDPSKDVKRLGEKRVVPVEVLPMATGPVLRTLDDVCTEATLRMGKEKDGPVVTDQGFWIIDARFEGGIDNPHAIDRMLRDLPGVLDHGLFLDMATDIFVGHPDGSVEHRQRDD
ncbi:ribose 5-phosphate isomerase A [Longibacter salinarum]|uniref:Ribose-5-phosphate isomerase A n=2 Tax=Longibacter salinarum TaxID=1850348 RepID=A0A2A8CXL3_9BACT|nr:ribose 5-phosphate isomerase A [Longibacter salinarum]